MKMNSTRARFKAAFTLVEVTIGAAVTLMILVGLLVASIALQRSYEASCYYSAALADQTRALDYIVRDARAALLVSVSADQKTLNLTLWDCYSAYDSQGNPTGIRYDPIISNNVVTYSDPAKPRIIRYYVSNRSLVREVTIVKTDTTSRTIIGGDVDNFEFNFGVLDSTVTASITFSPRFRGIVQTTDQNTTRSATIYMRNHSFE